MTEKLFWTDASLFNFTAVVTDLVDTAGQTAIVLNRTGFYPESGGQPGDLGTLNGVPLAAVNLAEDYRILHGLAEQGAFKIGDEVTGVIEPGRRREMTQQHTGQHILSQAFFQLFGAATKGFRILDDITQIDLTLEAEASAVPHALRAAEDLANQIVFENRAIRTYEVTPEEAAKLPLRKESFVSDCVRIVEIEDFDWSPCGGTHTRHTGEVGLLAVRGWERAKQMVRVEFVCGARVLRDYRVTNQISQELARRFSVGRGEVCEAVTRLQDESKAWQRRARALAAIAAQVEAATLWDQTSAQAGCRVVTHIFTDRDFEEAKLIAHRLVERPQTIALLVAQEATAARLVFARSADVAADMNVLMKAACEQLQGRGGGKPDFAQGGGGELATLPALLAGIKESLLPQRI